MKTIVGKVFECMDAVVLVLHVVNSDKGDLVVCLAYSYNHKNHSIVTYERANFDDWFLGNELTNSRDLFDIVKASDLL